MSVLFQFVSLYSCWSGVKANGSPCVMQNGTKLIETKCVNRNKCGNFGRKIHEIYHFIELFAFQLVFGQLIFFLLVSGVLCIRLVIDLGSSCLELSPCVSFYSEYSIRNSNVQCNLCGYVASPSYPHHSLILSVSRFNLLV